MVKSVKSQAKSKETKQPKAKPMKKAPAEQAFFCCDGKVFTDLEELAEGLQIMSDEAFCYHANGEKNDFSNWLRDVMEEEKLAADLTMVLNRLEAAGFVNSRLAVLCS